MSKTANVLVIGDPTPIEIASALQSSFGPVVDVQTTSVEDLFRLVFPDPETSARRVMHVNTNCTDYSDVFGGKRAACSIGASGSAARIVEALAASFGGFVDTEDENEWRYVERSATSDANAQSPGPSPRDRLKLDLAKIVGNRAAVELAPFIDDEDALSRLVVLFNEYREAENETRLRP